MTCPRWAHLPTHIGCASARGGPRKCRGPGPNQEPSGLQSRALATELSQLRLPRGAHASRARDGCYAMMFRACVYHRSFSLSLSLSLSSSSAALLLVSVYAVILQSSRRRPCPTGCRGSPVAAQILRRLGNLYCLGRARTIYKKACVTATAQLVP